MAARFDAPSPHDPVAAPAPSPSIDVDALAASLSGTVIRPDDDGYDAARTISNRLYDRRPTLIVRAADAADVARAVTFARDHDLELAVRAGGHSIPGFGSTNGGLVIDLSAMKGLHIDPERRLAWAQPGLTAGEYTVAAAAHGLATPFGDTGSVGIAGLTLGGGIGWLVRKHGLTIDSLVSVEVVTADGRIVTASEDRNPDLFWAIRGGGGNFGVVTRFVFRLHPVNGILGGALFRVRTRGSVDDHVHHGNAATAGAVTQIRVLGGAMARVPADATAFAHRDARIMVALVTDFEDPAEAPVHEAWTQAYFEELAPKGTGVYSNFLSVEGEERIREAYPAATYERLAEVKRAYDPSNLFRLNQNIVPAEPIANRSFGSL